MLSDAGCPGVADPGAALVAAAHVANRVVPLVGPSAVLLALMAAGMNGQRFAFHGYLPASADGRAQALRRLEADSRAQRCADLHRNALSQRRDARRDRRRARAGDACLRGRRSDVAGETVATRHVRDWRGRDASVYAKRPAIFLLHTDT